MPKVPFTAFFRGPAAIYTSSTGQANPTTLLPYLGTDFLLGNYADVSPSDVMVWNQQYQFSTPLYPGRFRIVQIASDAVAADINPYQPVGWALGQNVQAVSFTAGTGYTNGTYSISSSASTGQVAAVATVVVSGGAIISATIVQGGSGFVTTAPPTFSLTALGGGTGGAVTALLGATGYQVTSFSSVADSDTSIPRGIALCNPGPTSAQITAGAYIVIQENGIAPVTITTAGSTTQGAQVVAAVGGTANTQASAYSAVELGHSLDAPVAGQIARVVLSLPDLSGL